MPSTSPDDDSLRSFRLGDWLVEPKLGRISREGCVVRVRPRVLEVLATLAAAGGDVVSRRQLIDAVWSTSFVSDNVVSQAVTELRHALGDEVRRPRYIQNVPRRGYRLLADVTYVDGVPTRAGGEVAQFALTAGGTTHELVPGENVVGRSAAAHIRVHSLQASRRHARIVVEAGRAIVEDLGSKNGTFVNGRRISGPQALAEGDEVQFAAPAASFHFVAVGEATRTAAVTLSGRIPTDPAGSVPGERERES